MSQKLQLFTRQHARYAGVSWTQMQPNCINLCDRARRTHQHFSDRMNVSEYRIHSAIIETEGEKLPF